MCGWQVKLCDPLVTRGAYLSSLAVVLPLIRRYANIQITLTLTVQKCVVSLPVVIIRDAECWFFLWDSNSVSRTCFVT